MKKEEQAFCRQVTDIDGHRIGIQSPLDLKQDYFFYPEIPCSESLVSRDGLTEHRNLLQSLQGPGYCETPSSTH